MSLTASSIIASVRATLDYPDYDKLKPQLLFLKLREKVDHYFNRMALTDRNWFLDSEVLTVNGGEDEFPIVSSFFGRPILIETQDLTNPQHIRQTIKVIDLQDRGLLYDGPVQNPMVSGFDAKHSASSFTFFIRDGVKFAKVTPQPAEAADYVIWFEPTRPVPGTFTGNLTFLDQFQNLLVTDLSITCLPYCDWDAVVLSQDQYRRKTKADALREALNKDYALYAATFEEYIQNDRQQRIEVKAMWGDNPVGQGDSWW